MGPLEDDGPLAVHGDVTRLVDGRARLPREQAVVVAQQAVLDDIHAVGLLIAKLPPEPYDARFRKIMPHDGVAVHARDDGIRRGRRFVVDADGETGDAFGLVALAHQPGKGFPCRVHDHVVVAVLADDLPRAIDDPHGKDAPEGGRFVQDGKFSRHGSLYGWIHVAKYWADGITALREKDFLFL